MPELSRNKPLRRTPRRGVLEDLGFGRMRLVVIKIDCEASNQAILKGAAALFRAGLLAIQI